MHRIPRWLLSLSAAGLLTLSACGGGGGNDQATPQAAPQAAPQESKATLATGVQVLDTQQNAQFERRVDNEVTYTGDLTLSPGAVVLGETVAYKVVSTRKVDGKTVVTVSEPTLDELFDSLRIQGTFVATPQQTQSAQRADDREMPQAETATRAFAWDGKVSAGTSEISSTVAGTMTATVDYDYNKSMGGLQSSFFDLSTSLTFDTRAALKKTTSAPLGSPVKLGTVRIPVPVSVIDRVLTTVGVRLVSIVVPFTLNLRTESEVELSYGRAITVDGGTVVRYTKGKGTSFTETLSATPVDRDFVAKKPADGDLSVAFQERTDVFLRASPAVAFLDGSIALFGTNLDLVARGTSTVQFAPTTNLFCLSVSPSFLIQANWYFKAPGVNEKGEEPYSHELYKFPPRYVGDCKAPTLVSVATTAPSAGTYGQPLTVKVIVSRDTSKPYEFPSVRPTGKVAVKIGERSCEAVLSGASGTSSLGECTLTPLLSGAAAIASLTYLGDDKYAPSGREDPVTVGKAGTVVAMSTSPNPSSDGATVTLSASVLPSPSGDGEPTGTIRFTDLSDILVCTATITSAGTGQCTAAISGIGTKSFNASYSGDSNFTFGKTAAYGHSVTAAIEVGDGCVDTADHVLASGPWGSVSRKKCATLKRGIPVRFTDLFEFKPGPAGPTHGYIGIAGNTIVDTSGSFVIPRKWSALSRLASAWGTPDADPNCNYSDFLYNGAVPPHYSEVLLTIPTDYTGNSIVLANIWFTYILNCTQHISAEGIGQHDMTMPVRD